MQQTSDWTSERERQARGVRGKRVASERLQGREREEDPCVGARGSKSLYEGRIRMFHWLSNLQIKASEKPDVL